MYHLMEIATDDGAACLQLDLDAIKMMKIDASPIDAEPDRHQVVLGVAGLPEIVTVYVAADVAASIRDAWKARGQS